MKNKDYRRLAKIKKYLFIFLLWCISTYVDGQITGRIIDSSGKSLPGANVLILRTKDSSLIKGDITDDAGLFSIEYHDTANILLSVSMIGHQTQYKNLSNVIAKDGQYLAGTIKLVAVSVMLNDVVVTARKPFMEKENGRLTINIKNSIVSAGNNVLDVLKRMPGISISNDINIKLNGKTGVVIYIDNKPTYLSDEDLSDLLKSMDASQIDKIEIISNPSAEYDASGNAGIINIILKKNQMTGFNARLNAGYGYVLKGSVPGHFPDKTLGINSNYRTTRFNFFANYSYKKYNQFWDAQFTRVIQDNLTSNTKSTYAQGILKKNYFSTHNAKAGVDFLIDKKQTISVFSDIIISNQDADTRSNINVLDSANNLSSGLLTTSTEQNNKTNASLSLNYNIKLKKKGESLTVIADYGKFSRNRGIQFVDKYFNKNLVQIGGLDYLKGILPTEIHIKSGKVDYVNPLTTQTTIQVGFKSSYITSSNDFRYLIDTNGVYSTDNRKTNDFFYTEYINAGYLNFVRSINDALNFSLGLRAEQTLGKGKEIITGTSFSNKYFQLFPSASISWQSNQNNKFGLSYSRRIDRPSYQDLNPFLFYFDPFTYYQGNPSLKPQLSNAIEVTHSFKAFLTTTLGLSQTDHVITQIGTQSDSSDLLFFTNMNLATYRNLNLQAIATLPLTKIWTLTGTISGYYDKYKSQLQENILERNLFGYSINLDNAFIFKNGFSAEVNAYYNSESMYGISTVNPVGSLSAGIKKEIPSRQLSFNLNLSDLFWTERYKERLRYQRTNVNLNSNTGTRKINFSLSWSIGKLKSKQINRANSAGEEVNRLPK